MSGTHSQPRVTAVITTCHRPELCRRAVQSVLAQAYPALEILVMEDGGDSGVAGWLRATPAVELVRYLAHAQNRGLAAARNTALAAATGRFIAYLDDDDEWLPERVARQVAHALANPSAAVWYCGMETVTRYSTLRSRYRLQGAVREQIGRHGLGIIPDNTGLFEVAALRGLGGFDDALRTHTEYGVWMRLARAEAVAAGLPAHLVRAHRTAAPAQLTTNLEQRMQGTHRFAARWETDWQAWYGRAAADALQRDLFRRVLALYVEAAIDKDLAHFPWRAVVRALRTAPIGPRDRAGVGYWMLRGLVRKTPLYPALRAMRRTLRPSPAEAPGP